VDEGSKEILRRADRAVPDIQAAIRSSIDWRFAQDDD